MPEKEYIEREATIDFVKQNTPHFDGETTLECVERAIRYAPTADVAEVKHGEWVDKETCYACSLCGRVERLKEPYCHCGAKMHGN